MYGNPNMTKLSKCNLASSKRNAWNSLYVQTVTNPEEKSTRPCLHAVGYRVQLKHWLALWMWCARQRTFVRPESTQAQNRKVGVGTRLVSTCVLAPCTDSVDTCAPPSAHAHEHADGSSI